MRFHRVENVLLLSGTVLLLIGAMILLFPQEFYASNGTVLGSASSLLSEIRASGGLLLCCGVFVLTAIFRPVIRREALALSAMVYLAYGFARLLSIILDGMPATSLAVSAGVELFIGVLCITTQQTLRHPKRVGERERDVC